MLEELYELPNLKKILSHSGNAFTEALTDEDIFCFYSSDGKFLTLEFTSGSVEKRNGSEYYQIQGKIAGTTLKAELKLSYDPEYHVLEYGGKLYNIGTERSCSFKGPFSVMLNIDPSRLGQIRMYHLGGGRHTYRNYPPYAYEFRGTDGVLQLNEASGLSTDTEAPYILLTDESDSCGIVSAYEWPGRWIAYVNERKASGKTSELNIAWHQSGSNFYLEPGEEAVIPNAIFGFYQGDTVAGGNLLRHYFLKHMRRASYGNREFLPPVFFNHYYGSGNDFDEEFLRQEARFYAKAGCEYFVVDGGWFDKGFREGIGNWDTPDPQKFPSGLASFSDYVHSLGMKFGLWFEIEFAMKNSSWALKYPEMFMDAGHYKDTVKNTLYEEVLLRLDRPEVREFVLAFLVAKVREWKIDWLRMDCNNTPGAFWDANEPDDRRGYVQNQYCAGLYELLDEFGKQCPDLHIETCAGGGCRMDIGMLRRANSAWMSDLAGDYHCVRRFQINLNRFVPGFANSVFITPQGTQDNSIIFGTTAFPWEAVYSKLAGPFGISEKSSHFTERGASQLAEVIARYKAIRHYLLADFYPLFNPKRLANYDGWQFHDPDRDSGIFAIFRCESPEESVSLDLKGLSTGKRYVATQIGGDIPVVEFDLTGGQTREILFAHRGDCKFFHYKNIGK